uniref:Uncharacterized protein n=1 Tax=Anguilla anguilla TaxID=7936 RepID=A0A0E9XEL1_ANGAN
MNINREYIANLYLNCRI